MTEPMFAALAGPADVRPSGRVRLRVVVHGTPAPQGSKRHVGHGIMVESSKRLPAWRSLVTDEAWAARNGAATITGPVRLAVTFGFRRPKSHFGTGRNAGVLLALAPAFPTGRNIGDLSKHIRSIEDALTDAGLWRDDDQVVVIESAKKWWDDAGAEIVVVELVG